MSLLNMVGSSGAVVPKLDSSDVFSSYLTTGTGASLTVTTGIDLATNGGAIFRKGRSGATDWAVYDTARGATYDLVTNSTAAQTTQVQGLTAFSTTGHTWGTLAKVNTSTATYVDHVFRKAPKFFDIVTYTGNGVAGRQIPHNLGCEVGMIVVKTTSTADNWYVWHRSLPNSATGYLKLNTTDAHLASGTSWFTATSTNFTIVDNSANSNGVTYVAYLYAHDTSADGIIQCGSFTTDGASTFAHTLNWEAQYLLFKPSTGVADWKVVDTMRGFTASASGVEVLRPNTSGAASVDQTSPVLTATGFYGTGGVIASATYIYMAIRRPNKVPTSGTEVYNAQRTTSTTLPQPVTMGFVTDLAIRQSPDGAAPFWFDRLRGAQPTLNSTTTGSESNPGVNGFNNDLMTGWSDASTGAGATRQYWGFRRAKGFFDIVCYTGTGVARTVNHNLGVVPELMIVKSRSSISQWYVWHKNDITALLNSTGAGYSADRTVFATLPTNTVFGTDEADINTSSATYVAYLFATLAGISKVGSYTGNGTSQTINCGFTTGARFALIKRTDSTGDWYIFDSVRGIVAANDPHLSLNTTAAEVTTDDTIDPDASGFIVNQNTATNLNVTSASYIYFSVS